ncbi:hypothetical protein Vretifemale_1338 [Volvox reticuliferus]|uniref:Uncharacterized protein n=2 Tax=Volvox reticuliferus TaxID=1737510 RepID=A0A8J4FH84_9CHLO|nr:hypothetical protein Vretifemale_1338 [Volvox reticuliferus]
MSSSWELESPQQVEVTNGQGMPGEHEVHKLSALSTAFLLGRIHPYPVTVREIDALLEVLALENAGAMFLPFKWQDDVLQQLRGAACLFKFLPGATSAAGPAAACLSGGTACRKHRGHSGTDGAYKFATGWPAGPTHHRMQPNGGASCAAVCGSKRAGGSLPRARSTPFRAYKAGGRSPPESHPPCLWRRRQSCGTTRPPWITKSRSSGLPISLCCDDCVGRSLATA